MKAGGRGFPVAVGLVAALLAAAGLASAEADPSPEDAGDGSEEEALEDAPAYESVVTAPPLEDGPAELRVGRERLERSAGRSVAEALEREAGLHATTGSRGERSLQVRGFEQRQLFLVIDGVPAAIPYDGQLDLGKIPTDLVEDVVVLRGAGGLRFGPSGMGGTVSLRTRQPGSGPLISTRVEGGRGPELRLSVAHAHRAGRLSWLAGAGAASREAFPLSGLFGPTASEDGGGRDNSDRRLRHAVGRLRLELGPGAHLEATAWHVGGEWGIPPSTAERVPRYWRMTDWRSTVATVTHRWLPAPGLVLQEQVFVSLYDNLLDAYDDASYSSQTSPAAFHSWYHDLAAGGWVRLRARLPAGLLLRAEGGARFERHASERGGDEAAGEVSRVALLAAAQLERRIGRDLRLSAAFESAGEAGLEAAVRPTADAMVAIRWDPAPAWSAGLSAGRRSRIPTLRERYSSASGVGERLPSPDLRAEVAFHLGLDASWRLGERLRLDLSAYDAEVTDLIEQVPLAEGLDQYRNVGRARLLGAELLASASPLRWLELEVGYAFLHARGLPPGEAAEPLAYRPEHLLRLGVRLRPLARLELSSGARLVGPQRFRDPESGVWRRFGHYVAWDVRLEGRPYRGVTTWLEATNLLDFNYQTKYGYPDPGFQVRAGLRLELDRPR